MSAAGIDGMSMASPQPPKVVAMKRDPSGGLIAAALRRTLLQNKPLLRSKANWARLAGVPYGVVRGAFEGGRCLPSTLDALAAAAGLSVAEMVQGVPDDPAAAEAAVDAASFGRRLRMIGRWRGLTDTELAGRLGISVTRYGHYTRGRNEPSLAMIQAICTMLDLSPNELLGYGPHSRKAIRPRGRHPA